MSTMAPAGLADVFYGVVLLVVAGLVVLRFGGKTLTLSRANPAG